MVTIGLLLVAVPTVLFFYTYVGYPLLLALLTVRSKDTPLSMAEWPSISVSLCAYNEETAIGETLDAWVAADYPRDRIQILVASDASTDRTDEIVESFRDRGVELLRLEQRGGKTAAENAAAPHLTGDIVINTDASVRILPDSVKPLVAALGDPRVGVASGRNVSVGTGSADQTVGEGGYVSYEMWVRRLETRFGGIIGASGCLYAIRSELHREPIPDILSRDFASALTAREHGYVSVSVDDAVCLVPRSSSVRAEFRRKVRTISRGMHTLSHKRHLLNPIRYGAFSWKLMSHKVCRWLLPFTMPLGVIGLAVLSPSSVWAAILLAVVLLEIAAGVVGLSRSEDRPQPRILSIAAYGFTANVAAIAGFSKAIRQDTAYAAWEPTRRPGMDRKLDYSDS